MIFPDGEPELLNTLLSIGGTTGCSIPAKPTEFMQIQDGYRVDSEQFGSLVTHHLPQVISRTKMHTVGSSLDAMVNSPGEKDVPMTARLFDAKVLAGRGSSSAHFVSFEIPAVEPTKIPIQLPAVLPKAAESAVRKIFASKTMLVLHPSSH